MAESQESRIEKSKEYLRVYAMLMSAAQQRGFVTTKDVADLVDHGDEARTSVRTATAVLRLIDRRETQSRRPLLSSVVVSPTNHAPPATFYTSASELGLLARAASSDQKTTFW